MRIYLEERPDYYVGDYPSVTIHYRNKDKDEAHDLATSIGRKHINSLFNDGDSEQPKQCLVATHIRI